jgi:hypothetical protein
MQLSNFDMDHAVSIAQVDELTGREFITVPDVSALCGGTTLQLCVIRLKTLGFTVEPRFRRNGKRVYPWYFPDPLFR